ncbi:unnamed protein product [Brachionus calyciflorus]|uniref:Uncharacterized protein n=1 Tax=Brachionus calyciflorus TaxID=104777 RepID=A0A813WHD2_9BILA|nr:unnamed protein product [Brachionus calyciflorus]
MNNETETDQVENQIFLKGYTDVLNKHCENNLIRSVDDNEHKYLEKIDLPKQPSTKDVQFLQFSSKKALDNYFERDIYYGLFTDKFFRKFHNDKKIQESEILNDHEDKPDEKLKTRVSTLLKKSNTNKIFVIKLFTNTDRAFHAVLDDLELDPNALQDLSKISSSELGVCFIQKYGLNYPFCHYDKIVNSYIGVEISSNVKDQNELFNLGVNFLNNFEFVDFKENETNYLGGNTQSGEKFVYKIKTFKNNLPPIYEPNLTIKIEFMPVPDLIYIICQKSKLNFFLQDIFLRKAYQFERINQDFFVKRVMVFPEKIDCESWNEAKKFWDIYVRQPVFDEFTSLDDASQNNNNDVDLSKFLKSRFNRLYDLHYNSIKNIAESSLIYLDQDQNLNELIIDQMKMNRKLILVFFDKDLLNTRANIWSSIMNYLNHTMNNLKFLTVILVDYDNHQELRDKVLAYKKSIYIEYLFKMARKSKSILNYSNQGRIVFNDIQFLDNCPNLNLSKNNLIFLSKFQFNDYFYSCFIKELNLKDCSIQHLEPGCFSYLYLLESLDLSNNSLKVLGANFSQGLTNLKNLNLSDSKIETITPGALENLHNLIKLNLSNNKLTFIAEDTFQNSTLLESLDLGFNKIAEFENNLPFLTLRNLKKLYLDSNSFETINKILLTPLINLEILSLSGNRIETLGKVFTTLKNLKVLALNKCKLKSLDDGIFDNLESLEILFLHFNFMDFKKELFENLNNLYALSLYGGKGDQTTDKRDLINREKYPNLRYYIYRFTEKKIDSLISQYAKHAYSSVINEFYLKVSKF